MKILDSTAAMSDEASHATGVAAEDMARTIVATAGMIYPGTAQTHAPATRAINALTDYAAQHHNSV